MAATLMLEPPKDETTDRLAPPKPKPLAMTPLSTEYPSAPSTTGTPQNRLQLATHAFDTFAKSTAPAYQADLRAATQMAAGKGQIGSGGLRTTYGNLANQRALALDTQRDSLINAATTGTIADQQAADATALARYNAETSRLGTSGNLDVARGGLELAKQHEATSTGQTQQQIDLAKKQADINAAYQAGTLTLAQKDQALRELANQQQYGLEGQKLELAKTGQEASIGAEQQRIALAAKQQEIEQAYQNKQITLAERDAALRELANAQQYGIAGQQLELAKSGQAQQASQFGQSLDFQKEQAKIENAYKTGQLTLAQAQQKLAELAQAQSNANQQAQLTLQTRAQDAVEKYQAGTLSLAQRDQALKELAESHGNTLEQEKLQLAKDQLDQQGKQFGLSLAQQKELATIVDKTANRQIDVSSAQGKNALIVELARIMGAKDGTALDPKFVEAISRSLGIAAPTQAPTGTASAPPPDAIAQFGQALNREPTPSEYAEINAAWSRMGYDEFRAWAKARFGTQPANWQPPTTEQPPTGTETTSGTGFY
jgi:hypothetical protein